MACKKNKRLVPTLLICVGMMLPVCAKAETSGVTVVTEQQQSKQIRIVGITCYRGFCISEGYNFRNNNRYGWKLCIECSWKCYIGI